MKKHIKLLTIGTLLLGGLTGCNDFLDREPLDKVIPEKYVASESDLAAYTINAYPFETVTDAYGINFFGKDNDTDNQASGDSPAFWIPGQKKVPSGEHMQKIKEYMLKKYKDAQKENGYWLNNLDEYFYTGIDNTKDYEKIVNSITAKEVQDFLARLLKQNNEIQVVMTMPEEAK